MKTIHLSGALRRKKRISSNIKGTNACPRISLFRSARYIYAQAIDDAKKSTITSFSSVNLKKMKEYKKSTKSIEAKNVGIELAKKMKEIKIEKGVFDRGPYIYKGRVKALAEGLREGGIII